MRAGRGADCTSVHPPPPNTHTSVSYFFTEALTPGKQPGVSQPLPKGKVFQWKPKKNTFNSSLLRFRRQVQVQGGKTVPGCKFF